MASGRSIRLRAGRERNRGARRVRFSVGGFAALARMTRATGSRALRRANQGRQIG